MKAIKINKTLAKKCLSVIDAGLVSGLGQPIAGQMCVEAAINFALGREHGDDPGCVAQALRSLKIRLNDSGWSTPVARAKGLRRLALAQLGSLDHLDELAFVQAVAKLVIRKQVVQALRVTAPLLKEPHQAMLLSAANECESNPCKETAVKARDAAAYAAYAANAAAYAAAYAANAAANAAAYAANAAAYAANAKNKARDKVLAEFAEDVVQILIEMKAPGCQWLYLTEAA